MSKFEDLVPPLELCKQIPAGEFEDSALVWVGNQDGFECVCDRETSFFEGETLAPAPTLQEIMKELEYLGMYWPACDHVDDRWQVSCMVDTDSADSERKYEDKANPATATLKLWLEMEAK